MIDLLPEELRGDYAPYLLHPDPELEAVVKAADKLSALIKCMEEKNSGNQEFRSAEAGTRAAIEKAAEELPEVGDFLRDFLPAYGQTLDELTGAAGQ